MMKKITSKQKEASSLDGYMLRLNDVRKRLYDFEIPEIDRKLFWDLLTAEIDSTIEKCEELEENYNLGQPWTSEDDDQLKKFLKNKKPTSWEEEKIIKDDLVRMFRRPWRIIKRKVWALDLRNSVDYYPNIYARIYG